MDPVVAAISRFALAWVFTFAALHKLRDPSGFTAIVQGYRLVPDRVAPWVTAGLATAEAVGVVALLVPGLAAYGGAVVAALLVVYSLAIGTNLARGRRDVDCGCLGPGRRQPLSPWLLARNGALLAIALGCAVPVVARELGWLDFVTLGGGVVVAVSIFSAASRLAATAPVRALKGSR